MVQWLGLCAFIAKGVSLILGWYGQKKKKKGKKMTNINLNNKCNSVGKMESREICVWCGYAVLNSKTLSPP